MPGVDASHEQLAVLLRRLAAQTAAGRLRWDAGADGVLAARLADAVIVLSDKHGLVVRNAAGGVVAHTRELEGLRELVAEARTAVRGGAEVVDELLHELDAAPGTHRPEHRTPGAWGTRHGPDRD